MGRKTIVVIGRGRQVGPGGTSGGTRWDVRTTVFIRRGRPTPFGVYKIKKREGWGAGWAWGRRIGPCSIVVKPRF